MKLSEIQSDEEIKLEVVINGMPYEFKSRVIDSADGGGIFASPVRMNDKVVGLSSNNIIVNLILVRKNRIPVVWRRVSVQTDIHKRQTVYRIIAVTSGMEENRRNAYRLALGVQAVAQLGANTKAVDVTVRDISESGFAVISKENIEEFDGKLVHLSFADEGRNFSLIGLIVRKEQYAEDRYLYGCKLNQRYVMLSRYINEKQRKQIVEQKDIVLENAGVPKGFGDLRKPAVSEDNDKKVKALSPDNNKKIDNERYKNLNLKDEKKKKIDYERYSGLDFNS